MSEWVARKVLGPKREGVACWVLGPVRERDARNSVYEWDARMVVAS